MTLHSSVEPSSVDDRHHWMTVPLMTVPLMTVPLMTVPLMTVPLMTVPLDGSTDDGSLMTVMTVPLNRPLMTVH